MGLLFHFPILGIVFVSVIYIIILVARLSVCVRVFVHELLQVPWANLLHFFGKMFSIYPDLT